MKKTISWLYRNGRPLDIARLNYLFFDGTKEEVIKILKTYQNDDGGFGHGLEPDCFNPNSSPVQTMMAIEVIEELELDSNNNLIRSVINYLINNAPKDDYFFYSTIPSNNEYPHAPWWNYIEDRHIWGYMPTSMLAGFIHKYAINAMEREFAEEIINRAINDFLNNPTKEMHELRCYLDMANFIDKNNTFSKWEEFVEVLINTISSVIEKDESKWFTEYSIRPLHFFDNPNSIGYKEHKDIALKEVDMIMDQRNNEGYWDITWQWDTYPEAFIHAKLKWQSLLAVGYLKILKNYKKI